MTTWTYKAVFLTPIPLDRTSPPLCGRRDLPSGIDARRVSNRPAGGTVIEPAGERMRCAIPPYPFPTLVGADHLAPVGDGGGMAVPRCGRIEIAEVHQVIRRGRASRLGRQPT